MEPQQQPQQQQISADGPVSYSRRVIIWQDMKRD